MEHHSSFPSVLLPYELCLYRMRVMMRSGKIASDPFCCWIMPSNWPGCTPKSIRIGSRQCYALGSVRSSPRVSWTTSPWCMSGTPAVLSAVQRWEPPDSHVGPVLGISLSLWNCQLLMTLVNMDCLLSNRNIQKFNSCSTVQNRCNFNA